MSTAMRPFRSVDELLRGVHSIGRRYAWWPALMLLAACGGGGDSSPDTNSPLSTPMALVVNHDDTTMTTLRLDGKHSPTIGTLSLAGGAPAQAGAIGGVGFSLGEWIFVTNTVANKVAAIDPIGGAAPILEEFLDVNPTNPLVRLGQRPTRIYRDPGDKEVLLTMNAGDPVTGFDVIRPCAEGGSVTVLHNSHLSAGGEKPRVTTTVCLAGTGEHVAAFSRPTPAKPDREELAFVSSKTTGLINPLLADPRQGAVRWSPIGPGIDLCDSVEEQALAFPACDGTVATPNHAAPAALFWSQRTGKIYSYLSGYHTVVEIDPDNFSRTRTVKVTPPPPSAAVFQVAGITPDGGFLVLLGEDTISDPGKVIGKLGVIRLDTPAPLAVTVFTIAGLDHIRPEAIRFTPDGRRWYLTQSNSTSGLSPTQGANIKRDKVIGLDVSTLPAAPTVIAEVSLPAAESHAMDLWITGPPAAGSAQGVVVTNATSGLAGSVSLIDAATHTITSTIGVGKNPRQVMVYYVGLAGDDNQAPPL